MPEPDQSAAITNMAAASDMGGVRTENEDFYYFSKSRRFFIVCDGMGGHQRGAWASQIAGETIRDLLNARETVRSIVIGNKPFDIKKACEDIPEDLDLPALKLIAGVRLANRRIFKANTKRDPLKWTGTTVSTVLFEHGHAYIVHVGDSRVYRLRNGELRCLTSDHSWVNELIEDNEISQQQVEAFRNKNVLTRALGLAPSVKIDLRIEPVQTEDLYLLCSDGVHNALNAQLMQSILCAYHGSLQNKIINLVNSARLIDGSDNITGGLVQFGGHWQIGKPCEKQMTISEEPSRIVTYLDAMIRTLYPRHPSKIFTAKRGLGIVVTVLLLLLAALFAFRLI